jgi:nitrite reductase/ring-hydroxylating ferredoxin subunit
VYHGARFDACSGARKALPAVRPVRSFPVEVREGGIYVDLG